MERINRGTLMSKEETGASRPRLGADCNKEEGLTPSAMLSWRSPQG